MVLARGRQQDIRGEGKIVWTAAQIQKYDSYIFETETKVKVKLSNTRP